jgi:excisionase family DNA binding protein
MYANPPQLMTSSEVATLFEVDPATVRRWADDGLLQTIRVDRGHRRYLADEVDALYQISWSSRKTKSA